VELIHLLEEIERTTPESITAIHLICDDVPRFLTQFTPVHCSWMNQVEQ
jgi:hypothetical protein